jgi:hypothetical protein
MSVCCECCVLSGKVCVTNWSLALRSPTECDREASIMRSPWSTRGWCRHGKKKTAIVLISQADAKDNICDLSLGDALFESRRECRLSWGSSWFSSALAGTYRDSTLIRPLLLPFTHFPIYSLVNVIVYKFQPLNHSLNLLKPVHI